VSASRSTAQGEPKARVVVVDDEPLVTQTVQRLLTRSGYAVEAFCDVAPTLAWLQEHGDTVDVVLSDIHLGPHSGLDLLRAVHRGWPDVPVLLMTAQATIDSAIEALRTGAYDYLLKPFEPLDGVVAAVQRATRFRQLVVQNRRLSRQLDFDKRGTGVVGRSEAMRAAYSVIDSAAPTDATVLILGESGSGKELAARAVHQGSPRAASAFVAVNCAALTESVLESELFGHVRGAFTGALSSRRGLFEEASGGTLFLDEVGELSAATQAKLLRVLQEGEVRPVGSNEARKVDVRVVAATHRDLPGDVAAGRFRADLYYRLNVIAVSLPPLRDRPEDIPALVQHFNEKISKRLHRDTCAVEQAALDALVRYPWPGNVRELENAMERAVVLANGRPISPDLLPDWARGASSMSKPAAGDAQGRVVGMPLQEAREEFERRYLGELVEEAKGNVAQASRIAGLDPSNLRRLLKRYGIDPKASAG
jgi:DNA-binding NtrC family response regulator